MHNTPQQQMMAVQRKLHGIQQLHIVAYTAQNPTAAIVAVYHTLHEASHQHTDSFVKQYILTFSISNGYLVIRCTGLMRKLLRGMPLVLGSLWHCFTMVRNSGDSSVNC